MKELSYASVIVPCYNEEKNIGRCLDSIVANDHPKDKLEVMVVDGMSTDNTRDILKRYTDKYGYIRIIDNYARFTAQAFNLGIKNAQGEVIIIMGAHSEYSKDYISKSIYYLNKYNADDVGGIAKIVPRKNTIIGHSIAIVMSHPFGVGNAYYRISFDDSKLLKKPKFVDTVFGGAYRSDVFERIGLFNENLIRSQDMEFNRRLLRAGGKILLVPDIITTYYARSDLKSFCKHNLSDGQWSILPFKYSSSPVAFRHLLPFIFVSGLVLGPVFSLIHKYLFFFYATVLSIYLFLNIFFSFEVAIKKKDVRLFFPLLIIFPSRHISYGLGAFIGFMKLLFSWKREK